VRAKIVIAAVVVIAVGALFAASIQNIPGGHVGVTEAGGSLKLIQSGLYIRAPWRERAHLYPVEPASVKIPFTAQTAGGSIKGDLTVRLAVTGDRVTSLHRSYAGEYRENLITPIATDYLRRNLDVFGSYPGESSRGGIEQGLLQALVPALEPYGIQVHGVELESLDLVVDEEDAAIIEQARLLGGKVVIVGSDAFDWQIYGEISKIHPMPNIERLIDEGATGDLVSMEPLLSPMIWTTIATGIEPHIHGIIDFLMREEETGEDVPISSNMRRVPALWSILTRFGFTSGFIGWLGTYPAEPVAGFLVSDRIVYHTFDPRWQKGTYADDAAGAHADDVSGLAYPESLIYELRPLIVDYEGVPYEKLRQYIAVRPEEVIPQATTFDPLDPVRNLKLILAANTTYERIARYTYGRFQPDLLAVYLDMVDTVCHLFIKHMDPPTSDIPPEEVPKYGHAVAAAYMHTDSLVGEWLEMIDDETTLVLVSDHGFKSGEIRPSGPSAIGGGQAIKWHRLEGAIGLYGHRVKKGIRLTEASVLDVTPTILTLMGLPVADDMPGRVLEEALDEGWIASMAAVGSIASYGSMSAPGKAVRRKEEEAAIIERLKALGYVGRGSTGLARIAGAHFANAEFDKAIEIWYEILAQEPENTEARAAITNCLIHKGQPEEALAVIKEALNRDPDNTSAKNLMAMCYINLNRLDDADGVSREIIAEDPQNAEAYFNLGVTADKRGDREQAFLSFRRSVDLRPDYDESRINLANEYIRRGDFRQAERHLEAALEINPASAGARYLLGRSYQGMRDYERAAETYRETLARSPHFNPARISLSVILVNDGRHEEARDELEMGLQYDSELHLIHTNLGIVERKMGNLKAAEEHFQEAIRLDAYFLAPRFDLTDLYLSKGEGKLAKEQLEAILRIDPANDRARRLIAGLD
jgi:tetratricopeptide (TPR) repeat protein